MDRLRNGLAIGMIVVLGLFLVFAFWPYINALFGALILYVLFSPVFRWINSKLRLPRLSALITIFLTIMIVIIPIILLSSFLVTKVQDITHRAERFVEDLQSIEFLDQYIDEIDLEKEVKSQIYQIANVLRGSIFTVLNKVTLFILNLLVMYFLLYYLLIRANDIKRFGFEIIPFSKKNSNLLMKEFSNITNSVIISTGAIALMQGFLLGVIFLLFNVSGAAGALFWGIIGFFLSFLPVVGIPLLWIPAGLIKLFEGEPFLAAGVFVSGFILSNVDNFIRPAIQSRVGKIHPLITLIGVFIGIPFFGLMGLIVGPLLLSYFFLSLKMFKEEYIKKD